MFIAKADGYAVEFCDIYEMEEYINFEEFEEDE